MGDTRGVRDNDWGDEKGAEVPIVDEALADALLARAEAEGLELLGPQGLLGQMTKAVLERALGEELTGHLGYGPHERAGTSNSRNGTTPKRLITEAGTVELDVPRDRDGSFEPRIVPKGHRRVDGIDRLVISLYARGMTVRDIQDHLEEIYDVTVSPDLISKITDGVLEEVRDWQSRPLDAVYPVIFLDAIVCKVRDQGTVRNKAAHLAVGVDVEGCKEVLGIWVERTEGAKFWLRVLNELRARGVEDVLIVVCDGLVGLPDAIEAVWPQATVQTCIVHLTRASLRWVNYKDRKHVARELREIYAAPTETAAAEALDEFAASDLGQRYPAIEKSWRSAWEQVIPFFAFPPEIRKVLYTTNMIESINYQLRKITKTRGSFPTDDALIKLLYLGCKDLGRTRRTKKNQGRSGYVWKTALNQLEIMYPDRLQLT
jgi:putative transposase